MEVVAGKLVPPVWWDSTVPPTRNPSDVRCNETCQRLIDSLEK